MLQRTRDDRGRVLDASVGELHMVLIVDRFERCIHASSLDRVESFVMLTMDVVRLTLCTSEGSRIQTANRLTNTLTHFHVEAN